MKQPLHIGLRYGWKPDGTKTAPASTQPPAAGKGFDETTWRFPVHPTHGIPPEHPLAYCSDWAHPMFMSENVTREVIVSRSCVAGLIPILKVNRQKWALMLASGVRQRKNQG